MTAAIEFDRVSIVFGGAPHSALPLMDRGDSRSEIQKATNQILGVHDCSLKVAEGEISVLMGLSGSGKSTLLRAVNGLNPITRGRMLVRDGAEVIDVASCDASVLRRIRGRGVSMVFQNFGLLPWRTVLENVAFGLELSGATKAERHDRAMAELDTVNLTDWAHKKVSELSGGMRQRVGLARAFTTGAPILLMDEPFSALDPLIRARLQDELLDLQARSKRTIVFVSHDLEEAVKLGQTISILEGGRMVQTGSPEEIVLRPANTYVSDFVAHLNPLSVLRTRDAMTRGGVEADPGRQIGPDVPLREALALFASSDAPVSVMEGERLIGQILPATICRLLARQTIA